MNFITNNLKKGFTLIELLIVVAIIGILAGVGIPMYNGYMADAKINAVKTQHNQIVSYLSAEFQKCHMGSSTIFQDTWKKNQENCPIPAQNYVLRASASDTLTDIMGNVYLGSAISAFNSATQKGPVVPCTASFGSGDSGCHFFFYVDSEFTIISYFDDDGDITDKDSNPDFKKTIIRMD